MHKRLRQLLEDFFSRSVSFPLGNDCLVSLDQGRLTYRIFKKAGLLARRTEGWIEGRTELGSIVIRGNSRHDRDSSMQMRHASSICIWDAKLFPGRIGSQWVWVTRSVGSLDLGFVKNSGGRFEIRKDLTKLRVRSFLNLWLLVANSISTIAPSRSCEKSYSTLGA